MSRLNEQMATDCIKTKHENKSRAGVESINMCFFDDSLHNFGEVMAVGVKWLQGVSLKSTTWLLAKK